MNAQTRILVSSAREVETSINQLRLAYTVTIQGISADSGVVYVIVELTDKAE